MGPRKRVCFWAVGVVLASVVGLPLAAQEPSGVRPADPTKAPASKKVADASRRVPPFFGQIGLTPEQKEEIYKVRGKRQSQIESLHKQIAQLQSETLAECESLLSDSQKSLLTLRRDASARSKKSKAAATESPVASKVTEKPAN